MEIDPRLRDVSQRSDPYTYPPNPNPPPASYTLKPIRLPPPQPNGSSLPGGNESNHPYYSIQQDQQDPTSQTGHGQIRNAQAFEEPSAPPITRQNGAGKEDSKRPRACEACRGLKVRCEPDPANGTCRRCAKAGRQCIVTVPSRKRQKKTDSRVAELEKKIDALTASLQATKNQTISGSDGSSDEEYPPEPSATYGNGTQTEPSYQRRENAPWLQQSDLLSTFPTPTSNSHKRRRSSYQNKEEILGPDQRAAPISPKGESPVKIFGNNHNSILNANSASNRPVDQPLPSHEYADVVDRKILDMPTASKIFYHYSTNMVPHMPIVIFSPSTTAGEIRSTKPIIFLAILSVASRSENTDVQRTLLRETMRVYADSIICRGERSLEIIQALQISTIWYSPEEHKDTKPYQLIHMAAIMATIMGFGRPKMHAIGGLHGMQEGRLLRNNAVDTEAVESRRAWLGCYLMTSATASGMRQLNLIRWSSYMDDCVKCLENSADALPTDRLLCQWARLQQFSDDLATQFHLGDSFVDLRSPDKSCHQALQEFERRLDVLMEQKPKDIINLPLTLGYNAVRLYIHHIAIRLTNGSLAIVIQNEGKLADSTADQPTVLTTSQTDVLMTCISSIHKVIDTFLSFTVEEVRTIPTYHFVYTAYACFFLVRLHGSVINPDSEVSKRMPGLPARADSCLDQLEEKLQAAAADGKSRTAQWFQLALKMLKAWYKRQKESRDHSKRPEGTVHDLKLDAHPVDTERNSPGQKYRKISIQGSERSSASEQSKTRSPTVQRQSVQQLAQQPAQHDPIPQQRHQPPTNAFQMGNTPLHLLSEVAAGDPSASSHHLSTSGSGQGWYSNGYPQSLAPPPSNNQLSYPPDQHPYYGNSPAYNDAAFGNVYPPLHDSGLEQAMGMAFGADSEISNLFMDEGFINMIQHSNGVGGIPVGGYGGMDWEGGGELRGRPL